MIHLTICLPTRNRQKYCIETIRALAKSDRDDFEVIVGDNSDDESVLANFFESGFDDPRFRLVGPEETVLSMVDNWERLIGPAKGRWLSVIGDDDFVDPRLVLLLKYYERLYPEVESVSWARMSFNWPDNRQKPGLSVVPVAHDTYIAVKSISQDRLYRWSDGTKRPSVGFGLYHGAVRKSLMDRIKRKYGGRYFEHPTVDYENSCKIIREARMLVHCQRPFSVLGACTASNSAGAKSRATMLERVKTFKEETKGKVDMDDPVFPFPISDPGASICASIASTTFWFCRTYGIDLTGFPANFARAAMDEVGGTIVEEDYALKKAFFERGFDAWEGGRWRDCFKPIAFCGNRSHNELCGVLNNYLYIREDAPPAQTPVEFYRFAESLIMPIENVVSGARVFAR
ncbi:glycosyltransferase family A protein [Hoeflea sp.]|uniref:glycosyltransferase family A protein n=1 Tax=Hoeflea sp. TaxID=1940281 RepID=UPI0019AF5520|nr:glycosyltransferase family A protein [Hoeflea sp.]MBC7280428.1 glycosyltransferase family 2 protein [Hoeflea sp.]